MGWNITASDFHQGKSCTYAGGMAPFAKTKADRMSNHDTRPSLEERYTDIAGCVRRGEAHRGEPTPSSPRRNTAAC
jgi:hypothetical protein